MTVPSFKDSDKVYLTHKACEYLAEKYMAEKWPSLDRDSDTYGDIFGGILHYITMNAGLQD